MPTRQEMWDRLGGTVDVLVIGGGINGAGIARDAARRGLKVAVVEMKDLASGTSSNSSKLVHGGVRYLEQLEFSLVFESVSERRILMDIAPHLVNPLGFLFPVYKSSRQALTTINAGLWLYEGLSLFRSPKRHRNLSTSDVAVEEPALNRVQLKGAPLYYDCSTDDARLTLESALDAASAGAVIATWAKATNWLKDPKTGRVIGAEIEDQLSGETKEIRANVVINASGPWTDDVLGLNEEYTGDRELLRPTKGVHVVVTREKLPVRHAVVCFHPEDGRVLFAIPWGDRTYIGTTDTDYDGDPAEVAATLEDVDYLLGVTNTYFPEHQLKRSDVIATWAGLRPLIKPLSSNGKDIDESSVSREHQIVVGQDGVITIAGGKLTTYRRMSKEVVDTAVNYLRLSSRLPGAPLYDANTDREPLPGARGWPADDDHERVASAILDVASGRITAQTARLLGDTYGMLGLDVARLVRDEPELGRPLVEGRPEIMAQVDFGVRCELAATVSDVMMRRTQLFYRALDQGIEASEAVASRMATLLGWDAAMRTRSLHLYREDVGRATAWRDEM
ncbi:MAG: glycerol-3-phosphate dehydrogenase/oxidase [Myxococcota bacterium]